MEAATRSSPEIKIPGYINQVPGRRLRGDREVLHPTPYTLHPTPRPKSRTSRSPLYKYEILPGIPLNQSKAKIAKDNNPPMRYW